MVLQLSFTRGHSVNIAFVVVKNICRGGGIEKYTEELGTRLVQRGHNVRVYSMCNYGKIEPMHRGMEIIGVPCIPLTQCEKLSAGILGVAHAAISPWADIVHLHTVGPGAMGWFTRLCRKPSLIQYHGLEWKRGRWGGFGRAALRTLEKWSVLVNSNFTAVSRTQCEFFEETYGIQTRYIPGGSQVRSRRPAREIYALGLEPKGYVLSASRLVREKGAHYLIPAFRRLPTTDKLVIAGDAVGESSYKQELKALSGDDPRIVFTGFVDGPLLEELFAYARVYVQPSDMEGLSLSLLEAMSCGTDCLVSDIPENIEAVDTHGVTFRRGDIDDLEAKLRDMVCTDQAPEDRSQGAVARTRECYSWDQVADEFERYYQDILSKSLARATTEKEVN